MDVRAANLVRAFLDLSHMAQLDLVEHYAEQHQDLKTPLQELHQALDQVKSSEQSKFHQIDLNAQSIREIIDYPSVVVKELIDFLTEIIKTSKTLQVVEPISASEVKECLESTDSDEKKIATLIHKVAGEKYQGELALNDDLLNHSITIHDYAPSVMVNLHVKRPTSTADLYDEQFRHLLLFQSNMSLALFNQVAANYASRHNELYESAARTPAYYLGNEQIEPSLKKQIAIIYQAVKNYDKAKQTTNLKLEDFRTLDQIVEQINGGYETEDYLNQSINGGTKKTFDTPFDLYSISHILNKIRKANLVSIYGDDRFFLK